jgi:hypothetical protein
MDDGEPAAPERPQRRVRPHTLPALPGLGGRALAVFRKRWRAWLRAIHRDIGYLAVGLTLIYAVSGIAINHIKDWDPNFKTTEREHAIEPIPSDVPDEEAIQRVLDALAITAKPREADRVANQIEIYLDKRSLIADTETGTVYDTASEPRFFLRVANWLHYNRGKAAWTYIADAYAVLLLYLAISGIFMLKGRLGLKGRGAVLILAGAAVPILYVTLSSGP